MKKTWKSLGIFLVVILLFASVIVVVIEFNNEGKFYMEDPKPVEEEEKTYSFDNETDMSEDEIKEIINEKRDDIINFFKGAQYYTISELDENYTVEDDETLMALDASFLNDLRSRLTEQLYEESVKDFEVIKTEENNAYYKARKDTFEPLFCESAIATLQTNNMEIELLSAKEDEIKCNIKIQICEENPYNLCRRDDSYPFYLEKVENNWKIAKLK